MFSWLFKRKPKEDNIADFWERNDKTGELEGFKNDRLDYSLCGRPGATCLSVSHCRYSNMNDVTK